MDTPIRSVNNGKFRVPATPHLKRIGYGTGNPIYIMVVVFLLIYLHPLYSGYL